MAVTVPLYGSAISRDILYLLYYYTPPPPPPPAVSPTVSFSTAHRGMPTFHSTIFLSRTRTKRRQEVVVVEVDGSALRPPRTPTRATYTGGFRRIGRYFGEPRLEPWGYRYSGKSGEDLSSLRRKFHGILFKLAELYFSSGF